jgi:hypothetical protein
MHTQVLDQGEYDVEQDLRDGCGGASLTVLANGDVHRHGMYHYRTASDCVGVPAASLSGATADDGHSRLIGFMLDGVPLYAYMDGLEDLDECGGHVDQGRPFYHYHAAGAVHPYTVPCLRGCLRPEYLRGVNVDLLARSVCVPSSMQYDYSELTYAPWLTATRRNSRALTLAGGFKSAFRVDMVCASTPHGVPTVEYEVGSEMVPNGESPANEGDDLDTGGEAPAPGGIEWDGQTTQARGTVYTYLVEASSLVKKHVRARCVLEGMQHSEYAASDGILVTEVSCGRTRKCVCVCVWYSHVHVRVRLCKHSKLCAEKSRS